MPESSIGSATLRAMLADADKAKAELNLALHVRTLVAEVERLTAGAAKPVTLDQANVAIGVLSTTGPVGGDLVVAARGVLLRFLD
jgi:hypothetical protein